VERADGEGDPIARAPVVTEAPDQVVDVEHLLGLAPHLVQLLLGWVDAMRLQPLDQAVKPAAPGTRRRFGHHADSPYRGAVVRMRRVAISVGVWRTTMPSGVQLSTVMASPEGVADSTSSWAATGCGGSVGSSALVAVSGSGSGAGTLRGCSESVLVW